MLGFVLQLWHVTLKRFQKYLRKFLRPRYVYNRIILLDRLVKSIDIKVIFAYFHITTMNKISIGTIILCLDLRARLCTRRFKSFISKITNLLIMQFNNLFSIVVIFKILIWNEYNLHKHSIVVRHCKSLIILIYNNSYNFIHQRSNSVRGKIYDTTNFYPLLHSRGCSSKLSKQRIFSRK